jgi:hypothetical protein
MAGYTSSYPIVLEHLHDHVMTAADVGDLFNVFQVKLPDTAIVHVKTYKRLLGKQACRQDQASQKNEYLFHMFSKSQKVERSKSQKNRDSFNHASVCQSA